jgi:(2Fe-2S) ferredoxin
MVTPKHHVFVCLSCRQNGQLRGACFSKESGEILQKFSEVVDEHELTDDVMITNCGCFGLCSHAPVVAVYPDGVFYGGVTPDDVEEIVESHLENGRKVERLEIK